MFNDNLLLQTDSYKASHWKQYPKGISHQYSYFEARGGLYKQTLFFGLQYYLKRYLEGVRVFIDNLDDAEDFFSDHFGDPTIFFRAGWEHIWRQHQGLLPIEIKAVPEGTLVDVKNVLFTVENTCPEDFWLTSYLETLLSKIWYPTTVATKSYYMKQIIKQYLDVTGDDLPDFKLHDFGYRGSTSEESALLGGAAHLVNFKGSDTLAGIVGLQEYYHAPMAAFSIPAAEHSTITAWGTDREVDSYRNLLEQFPKGLVAVVSDSYDLYHTCKEIWGETLRTLIAERDGVLIIRPDSGDPVDVLPKVLEILGSRFGYTTNKKGYQVLPSFLRVIQGDGITEFTLQAILEGLKRFKWSADNIAFGSGGGLLQQLDRDTCQFAYKCSNVTIDGKDHPVSKNPATDLNKRSKAGRLVLVKEPEGFKTYQTSEKNHELDELKTVFKDGKLLIDQTLDEIRTRVV